MRSRATPPRAHRILLHSCVAGAVLLGLTAGSPAWAQQIGAPIVRPAVAAGGAAMGLAAMATAAGAPVVPQWKPGDPVVDRGDLDREGQLGPPVGPPRAAAMDTALQAEALLAPTGPQPTIAASFDGIPATGFVPPDIAGAVGPKHYIQMVNAALAIFSKTGQTLLGPVQINSLWAGFGGPCETENAGDPIVRYDRLANRWMVSQFAIHADFQCIAVSRGPDPVNSGWFRYAFPTVTPTGQKVTPDYPKIGVWPDGYYMGTQRGFPNGGLDVWVFERAKMLVGAPARQVQFSVAAPSLFLMPADFDGPPPPAGAPNPFVRHVDGTQFGGKDRLEVFNFKVNWANPAQSSFTLAATIPVAPFNAVLCNDPFSGVCVDQPGTQQKLETLPAWIMWRAQYRNFSKYHTLVTNHTINVDGHGRAGVRWYELRQRAAGLWKLYQQGTQSPDATHRWMASAAMDQGGNIALGYTASSTHVFPSMRAGTRRSNDPLGTMAQGEITLVNGSGSQTTNFARWGDYSTLDVDPVTPCRFWYTSEYYKTTSAAGWRTRIVSFQMPICPAVPPAPG